MSVIDKKPFLTSLIETLTEEQISALKVMMNGGGNPTVLMRTMHASPLGERTHLTAADKGIHRCNLEVDFSLLNGYLIYNNTYCVLIVFTDFQTLSWYTIDVANQRIAKITEELSILELRSELDDSSAAEKAEIISVVKEAIAEGEIKVVTLENGTNFTNLSDELLSSLKAGDIVTKQDESGKHAYMVSYKKDGTGICLTYSDAGYLETVSYDYTDSHWVYNSTDVVTIKETTFSPFNPNWPVNGTTKALCDAVNADSKAVEGNGYLGEAYLSDFPGSISNAEIKVEIMSGSGSSNKVIHLSLSSGNVAPYKWEYTYWGNGTNLSGWVPMGDNNSAPVYSASATYVVGDLVLYGNVLYECTTAVASPEAFDSTKWTRTTVAGAILGMINAGY